MARFTFILQYNAGYARNSFLAKTSLIHSAVLTQSRRRGRGSSLIFCRQTPDLYNKRQKLNMYKCINKSNECDRDDKETDGQNDTHHMAKTELYL